MKICNRKENRLIVLLALALLGAILCLLPAVGMAAEDKPLKWKTISVMGDSISTYTGWSDKYPITAPECTNRYGEAYYGPVGGEFHNTELLVTDTCWHQAAEQLGAKILMSNAGNSTGVFYASYPANAAWDLYLKEMLAWKTRPDYMGRNGRKPDIIALYIGSNEVGRCKANEFGSVEDVDFDELIRLTDESAAGSQRYTYATPKTVAEAYCIMMHKLKVNYPDAEIYCFAAVPNAGVSLTGDPMPTINGRYRFQNALVFREMVAGIAEHYGAILVDLIEGFGLDQDGDGQMSREEFDAFQPCFNNDPHPTAQGFDVITECFVNAVLENSKYIREGEDTPEPKPETTPVPVQPDTQLPKTGDSSMMALWISLLCVAMAGAALVRRAKSRA